MSNRLGDADSPYLRSAATQPVHWRPWGKEAFAAAAREGKPILLDVGAAWCHWCHVMDHESYEDPATAERINRLFIAVKVDRDERPDVDARYQKAIQQMTGQGGWPLTAFLLPDGRAFYGGTYFPPVDAHGRPSFGRVLDAVADAFRTRREEIEKQAGHLADHLARRPALAPPGPDDGDLDARLVRAVRRMQEDHDVEHGGFGGAPKFPHPAALDLLLARADVDGAARDIAIVTLERMRQGGVHDQLAGGFHRYSVDAAWRVPHFEKMLYDNAGLLRNHARAFAVTGDAALAEGARDVVRFLRDVLLLESGAFGGSQDADLPPSVGGRAGHDDGDHFTWTLEEVQRAIGDPALAHLVATHFGVRPHGDMHHDPARCVLRVAADAEALSAAFGRPVEDVRADLQRGIDLLRRARAARPTPFVDPTPYAAWNGMAAAALLEAGGRLEDEAPDALGLRALDAFLAGGFDPRRGFPRTLRGRTYGLLDDDAQMLDALLEAHLATGRPDLLAAAKAVGDLLLDAFSDETPGFMDRAPSVAPPAESAPLEAPERPLQDAPTASATGVALAALLRLADATGDPRYHAKAERDLRALAPTAERLGVFGGALLLGIERLARPPPRVLVRGDVAGARALVRRVAPPGAVLLAMDAPGAPPEAEAFRGEGALVCVGTRCLAPARDLGELRARLGEARTGKTS